MTKKCICQICSCGRHRCPHGASNPGRVINKIQEDKCSVTEYKGNYHQTSPRRGPFNRPTDLLQPEGTIPDATTNRAAFIPHDVSPPKKKEPERYVPNPNKFDFVSENKDHYIGSRAPPARMKPYLRGTTMRVPSAQIQYKSTTHGDYRTWRPEPLEQITRSKTYAPPEEPFMETSIHRQDFTRFNQPPRPTARQPDKIRMEGSIENQTTSLMHYAPKEIPPRREKKMEEYAAPEQPFNSTSIFKADFQDFRKAPKAAICRPVSDLFATDKPMQSETTKDMDFRGWEVRARKQKTPERYTKPDGDVECKTTTMDYGNFGRKALPAKNARPRTKLKFGREDMLDDTTNYGTSFRWVAKPVVHSKGPAVRNEIFPKAESGFNETSEFLDRYKRFNVAPPKMFKDKSNLFKTNERLAKDTVYNGDFDWPDVKCPSHNLLKGSGDFTFHHATEAGHQVFEMPAINTNGAQNLTTNKEVSLTVA